MFSDELMRFLIKYQGKDFVNEEKDFTEEKNDGSFFKFHRFTQFAVAPVTVER